MDTLLDITRDTVRQYDMFPAGGAALVMVSGGADSMALLSLLAEGSLGAEVGVSALHVNHLLRGVEAARDEEFVRDECARMGVRLAVEREDVFSFASARGLNIEDAGRIIRYGMATKHADALARVRGIDPDGVRIAVAHTLDDRIETMLMHLLAGSGAGGITSMRHVRGRVVRPFLDCDRTLVRSWYASRGGRWREDATNADTSRRRARVRHEVLPALERIEPAFRRTLARSLRLLAEEDAALFELAAEGRARAVVRTLLDHEVALSKFELRRLHPAVRRRVLRDVVVEVFPHASRIELSHVDSVASAVEQERFARDMSYGLRAFSECDTIMIVRRTVGDTAMAPCLLDIPGTADLGPAGVIVAEEVVAIRADRGPLEALIHGDGLAALDVGAVHPGERMRPLGMSGTKKLSDVLVDAKVPRRLRGLLPVVRDAGKVVWVAGVRQSEAYRMRADTGQPIRLRWYPGQAFGGNAVWLGCQAVGVDRSGNAPRS